MNVTVEQHHHSEMKSCKFPKWLTEHHQWHTLDHSKVFHFSAKNASLRESGPGSKVQMRAVCHSYETDSDSLAKIVAHVTVGWYVVDSVGPVLGATKRRVSVGSLEAECKGKIRMTI